MTLQEKITQDLAMAITNRDNQKRDFLKVVVGELSRKESKASSDSETIALLKKMMENAKALNNEIEIAFCNEYLPSMMSEEEIAALVGNIILANNFTTKKELGKIMSIISGHPKSDTIDKKLVAKYVSQILN